MGDNERGGMEWLIAITKNNSTTQAQQIATTSKKKHSFIL
jgi:hypothetical protein